MGIANEIEHVGGGADVRRESVAKIGIEIGEPGAIDDHVERILEAAAHFGLQAEAGFRDVAFDDFDMLAQEFGEERAVAVGEAFEDGRFFDDAAETVERGGGLIAADEQIDLADFREVGEKTREPDFADEAGGADEENVFAAKRITNGKRRAAIR